MNVGHRARLDDQPTELLARAFDRSPVPKLVLSLTEAEYGQFSAVNDAFCELVGYPREELLGQSCLMLLDQDGLGPVTELFAAMVRGELSVMAMERVLIRRDGSRVWIVSQNVLVHDRDDHPRLVAEIVESSSRPALAGSEARFRTLVDSSPIGMAVLDPDGAWLRVNPAVSAILGYTGAELAGLTLGGLTHPDERADCAAMLRDLARGARPGFEGHFRYVGKDGRVLWCRLTVTPLHAESGAPLELLAQLADVTAERRSQELLVEAEQAAAREAGRLRTTITVQREINAVAENRDALVRLIADRILQVIPAGRSASVHLLEDDSGMLRPVADAGMTLPAVPVTESLAGVALTSGGTVRSDDTAGDPRVNPVIARATGMGSLVIAPLRAPGAGPFGVLMVGSDRPYAFDDGDERQLTLVADSIGSALRHAENTAARAATLAALEREQQRLARSERQFAEVADNSPIARIVLGLRAGRRGRILLTNPAFCLLFGYPDAEALGMHFEVLLGGPDADLERSLDIMAAGDYPRGARELVLHRKDGTPLVVTAHSSVITDENGPATVVIQLLDVTAERAAGRSTEREVRRLRATLAVQRAVTEAATDRAAAVRVVADRAVELFPAADGAAVELIDGDQLAYVATAGTLTPFTGTRIPRSGSLSGIALSTDAPAHCPDTTTDPRVNQAMCAKLGIGSMLIAPLHAEHEVIGVLKVSAAAAHVFDDTDEQQLALLADSLSAALRHADDATRNAEALRRVEISERRFRLIFDNSPLGLTLCSLRTEDFGRYLQANPAMTAITGYTQDELRQMTFAELTHPDDVASTRDYARRFIAGEIESAGMERRYVHRDGHTVWVALRVALIVNDDDHARYVVIQVEDVTAAREVDAQLRRSARLFELIPAAVVVRDPDGTIRWWNDGATRLYGWPLPAAAGKRAHRLLHTTFPYGGSVAEQQEALSRDGYWNGQLDHITADGRTVTVLSRQVLHHLDPDHAQVLEVSSDVTAARAAEQALAESEQRLRAQFANTGVGQIIVALDGALIRANRAYATMLGRTDDELPAQYDELLYPDDLVTHRSLLAGLFAGDSESYTTEARLAHADGHWVPVEATISLVRDPAGHPKLIVGVLADITARRAAEQARDAASAALAERNTELEAANQLKLDIIGMLGHEIGNPLTSIRGNAEILTDDWPALTDDRRGRAIEAIARQAGALDEIVQEVLAMVTIESGKIRADRRALRAREEIDRAQWAAQGSEPVPVSGPDAVVLCHPGHLQQILVNLLSNARKYGGGATAVRVAETGGQVEITVEDDGPGVPGEFRSRLFERLARADRDATTVKGTGLGLYIVRGLAQANHGDIRHEPNPSGGSRFILSLESATAA
ncbi:PAS/PAC sensor hybrid histidine kinase [Actinoplanes sp. SE50]|uniref:PAS domain S-box protein n=1 Tax=unclassified Actinoplanes TaxID=2626549 RepID=UPI00023ECECB|nr:MULTISPECIES: PAS domain S-box protein [unclassified Actinoplanes]AEV85496.1 PAS/PAC sensor hybrid histidine kinase [Actinoplanes sp. SE50/110]ATO83889.1 PAS/PAC sensor hybrid histidine kinase [Actinoplanes sp. SE50]SLM01299.1 PAS/PAC sensor hybrid histidine kinase [Actinoplanes sp. SE50/110]